MTAGVTVFSVNDDFFGGQKVPIDRNNSFKVNASSGISTRTGTNFDTVGAAWRYRWGAGL
jgi:hypothetical protein